MQAKSGCGSEIAVAVGLHSLAAAYGARCMENCLVGSLPASSAIRETFMLSHGLPLSCLLPALLRQLIQEAHLTPCQCRELHALSG